MRLLIVGLVTAILVVPSVATWAQESPTPSPSPSAEEETCPIGQLCSDTNVETPTKREPVEDPAGNYVRSLITIGAIALLVGSYLFFAFGWGRFFSRSRRGEGRS
jgi:hypothetical protein